MSKTIPPTIFSFSIPPEELNQLTDKIEQRIIKNGSMSHIRPDGRNIQLTQEQLTEYIELMKSQRNNG